jgi:hypothetical protein
MSFSVLAILGARNEIDILPRVMEHLRAQGVDVHFIDDWSTDGTWEASFGWDLVGRERFPAHAPSRTFDWAKICRRKEEIAAQSQASWFIQHDADEIRRSPRAGETLREMLQRLDAQGYNAVEHELLSYRSRNGWKHGMDPEVFFTELEEGATAKNRWSDLHIKAWKNTGARVDLASMAGHEVKFPGRRLAPEKILLKHYPLRGPELAAVKLADRRSRWNQEERRRGWHVQYDQSTSRVSAPPVVAARPMPAPGVSLVVPSKFPDIFAQLAESIDRYGQDIDELIVVVDGDWSPRASQWKRVQGAQPFGFSRNCNRGIAAAKPANDILLINDDVTLLAPNSIAQLRAAAAVNPRAGLVSPRFQGAVGNPLQMANLRLSGTIISRQRLAFVSVLLPRATINRVGLLDERFGAGYGGEDDDYCLRTQRAGLDLVICAGVTMRHGFGAHTYSASVLRLMTPQQREASMQEMLGVVRQKWA